MSRPLFSLFLTVALFFTAARTHAQTPNALVSLSVASLRALPSHSAELETQATMGTPVCISDTVGDWLPATLPDGYRAYIHRSAVHRTDVEKWNQSQRLISVEPFEQHILSDTLNPRSVICDFTLGSIVRGKIRPGSQFTAVLLPDSTSGYVKTTSVQPFGQWMQRPYNPQRPVEIARALSGVPYLWGGRSTKMIDCSGLTQLCYFDSGFLLPRNASAQALCGTDVNLHSLRPSDLLFFRNENGKITHVAINIDGILYIHASGKVHISSRMENHPLYNGRTVHLARRISSLPRVINHPWY